MSTKAEREAKEVIYNRWQEGSSDRRDLEDLLAALTAPLYVWRMAAGMARESNAQAAGGTAWHSADHRRSSALDTIHQQIMAYAIGHQYAGRESRPASSVAELPAGLPAGLHPEVVDE